MHACPKRFRASGLPPDDRTGASTGRFTSLGADVDKAVNSGGGPYVYKICGVVYHRIGSLLPTGPDRKSTRLNSSHWE